MIITGLLSSFFAVKALLGNSYEIIMEGTMIFGKVPVRIDALSGWFILVINFTILTGAFYGFNYMKKYRDRKNELTLALDCIYIGSFCSDRYLFCSEWIYFPVIMGIDGNFSLYPCNI